VLDHTIHIFSRTVAMQMSVKKPNRILKESIMLMDIMSGEDRMHYLDRMWSLYLKVYKNPPTVAAKRRKQKYSVLDKRKAYDLCSSLVKIFGH